MPLTIVSDPDTGELTDSGECNSCSAYQTIDEARSAGAVTNSGSLTCYSLCEDQQSDSACTAHTVGATLGLDLPLEDLEDDDETRTLADVISDLEDALQTILAAQLDVSPLDVSCGITNVEERNRITVDAAVEWIVSQIDAISANRLQTAIEDVATLLETSEVQVGNDQIALQVTDVRVDGEAVGRPECPANAEQQVSGHLEHF